MQQSCKGNSGGRKGLDKITETRVDSDSFFHYLIMKFKLFFVYCLLDLLSLNLLWDLEEEHLHGNTMLDIKLKGDF